jgi:TRAP-type C4-dicarboxylate transport system permease large subunit
MGTIAIPEMRRFKYDPALAVGVVAAGGTLSFLIPPSLGFVVYGMLTEQSIGKLLVSGILRVILSSFIAVIVSRLSSTQTSRPPPRPRDLERKATLWGGMGNLWS